MIGVGVVVVEVVVAVSKADVDNDEYDSRHIFEITVNDSTLIKYTWPLEQPIPKMGVFSIFT